MKKAMAIALLGASVSLQAAWLPPTNKDLCWSADNVGGRVQMRFTRVGEKPNRSRYYQVNGMIKGDSGIINPLFGSMVITPKRLLGTTTHSARKGANHWAETVNWVLNRNTRVLSGRTIGIDALNQQQYFETFTLKLVPCP